MKEVWERIRKGYARRLLPAGVLFEEHRRKPRGAGVPLIQISGVRQLLGAGTRPPGAVGVSEVELVDGRLGSHGIEELLEGRFIEIPEPAVVLVFRSEERRVGKGWRD